jgi:hypothetical protein
MHIPRAAHGCPSAQTGQKYERGRYPLACDACIVLSDARGISDWFRGANALDVGRLEPFGARLRVKFHHFTFLERAETFGGDHGVMHEDILPSFSQDKPEALLIVEPLHFPHRPSHSSTPV